MSETQRTRSASPESGQQQQNDSRDTEPSTALGSWWQRNQAWVLVLAAQGFGAGMNATARLLVHETNGAAMHPMQIIFVRMGVTLILSTLYMLVVKVPDFPWGPSRVRGWLVLRGLTGLFGLWALYWSLQYLPLAEVTVLNFLTPMMVPWTGAILFHEPISIKVALAGIVSFAGVIVIARPPWIFHGDGAQHDAPSSSGTPVTMRTAAVMFLLAGAVAAAVSYTIIRGVGQRAHALISVNYYSVVSMVGSALYLLCVPGVGFMLPVDGRQWALLASVGLCGFFLQFLLTSGLQHDKSAAVTMTMYTRVLFALLFDLLIWDNVPGATSWCGGGMVLATTAYVAFRGRGGADGTERSECERDRDEEQSLLAGRRRLREEE